MSAIEQTQLIHDSERNYTFSVIDGSAEILLNENLLKSALIMYRIFALLRFLLKHNFTVSAIIHPTPSKKKKKATKYDNISIYYLTLKVR